MLKIVTAPNSILSQKAKPVARVDKTILKLIEQMEEALDAATDPIGVGLAAPQVNKSLAIFVIKPSPKAKLQAFINPKITKIESQTVGKAKGKTKKLEGCLSLVNIWGEVERAKAVWLDYLDIEEKPHHKKFTGFIATIIQHEVDHLTGILFPKRVLEQKGTLYESKKNRKGEDIFEELTI
ncbi:MAG TPA: peptide deformylase [Patescibacteria group bacterium]|jgi:peptide deformylase|nr:peptide deformylase [Patescibacteria group bacterium]